MPATDDSLSPIAPLRLPVFRLLWSTWLVANLCMWMNDVAAAWMMTSLTTTPIWVALVQTASTLPVFLLGLPSGALADNLDRKRYYLVTQLWVAVVAMVLSGFVFFGVMSPLLLLALTFANGIGFAMRWPVFSAIVPELVPRPQLPAALALNGVAMNASRIIGPLVAGALIAGAGSAWVFLLNAVLSLVAAAGIARWHREHKPHPLGRERLGTAMRVGWQYVSQSYLLKGVLLRICIFFFHSTALLALLALLARGMQGGGAGTFTLLLASMGAGAIVSTFFLPRLRRRYPRDALVLRGALLQAAAMAVMALTDRVWVAVPAMFFGGAAWITTANTLSVSIQMGLPDWVRARGMSIYQMSIMGASASGAALWGQIATWTSLSVALGIAAASGWVAMALANRWMPDRGPEGDLTPQRVLTTATSVESPPQRGHIMLTIEYLIDPARAKEFRDLMFNESRRSRLRQGALSWELLHDINKPGRFVEVIVDESWTDHLRRFDRSTAADVDLRDRRLAFHIGLEPPRVTRHLMETTVRGG
ncbi:MAG: MFS transporter [Comamonadaceae bacterium]|jgi:MFS family permease|uniref:MFS transporter n=1 Tax=Hydrogenophaga borbori TaxID=2294117 RepID=A0A372EHN7_9BURK|nr:MULTISPECIES: MFS transporter [Hydrogenophaga]NCT97744.1 MFS transporter [Comamonadaceae bacterium]RFP77968.1 MFS transporter [Hydrogenophaga borbori]WQB83046.1 MFS transporter [Hydrogenophaga sp. SNF1]